VLDEAAELEVPLSGGRCHHDPGPNNTVFRDGRPVALIDFDFAAVGDPLEDVGYGLVVVHLVRADAGTADRAGASGAGPL
jgi:aminoglycoside phosphotransferase (APT) family kinase protein